MSYTVEQFLHCDPLKLSPVVSGLSCLILSNFSILCLIKRCWLVCWLLVVSLSLVGGKRKEKRNWAEKEKLREKEIGRKKKKNIE